MVSETRLKDAFGELIYSVAIADGMIQDEETDTLDKALEDHPWEEEIKWSFNYERKKKSSLKETYLKALDTFKEYGPHRDYKTLIELLEKIAESSDGFQSKEGKVISIFQKSLRAHFLEFMDENNFRRRQ